MAVSPCWGSSFARCQTIAPYPTDRRPARRTRTGPSGIGLARCIRWALVPGGICPVLTHWPATCTALNPLRRSTG